MNRILVIAFAIFIASCNSGNKKRDAGDSVEIPTPDTVTTFSGVDSSSEFLDSFSSNLQPWLDQIMHFPEEVVDQAYKQAPPEWIAGDEEAFEQLLEKLLRRRKRLPDLISDCRKARINPFPHWT